MSLSIRHKDRDAPFDIRSKRNHAAGPEDARMDADVRLADGTILHLRDVEVQPRTLTATVDGRRVSLPKDRWLAQKVLIACERAGRRVA